MNTDVKTDVAGKRGRKAGVKVVSLDMRAFQALYMLDFEELLNADDFGSKAWHVRACNTIIDALREGDDPVF